MKKLHMTFLNEDGSKKKLVIHCVHQELSPEVVREAMQQIVDLDLFEKDGIRLMTEVHSAKYVEIIETPLFDNISEMALPVPTPPVEENGPDIEMMEASTSDKIEEELGNHEEAVCQSEPTPKKQLAKIYPFIPREEWELKKANYRKNQNGLHSIRQRCQTNQQSDFIELVEPLFAPEQSKAPLRLIECRDRGAPSLDVAA